MKEKLQIRGYVRYMDDMVLWHTDRHAFCEIHAQCQAFLSNALALAVKPAVVQFANSGVSFLGYVVLPTPVELNRRSKRRWRIRIQVLERAERLGLISELDLRSRLTSQTAFANCAGVKSWRFRNRVLQELTVDDP